MPEKGCGYWFSRGILAVITTGVGALVNGFVLVRLWTWFAVPSLGVRQISFVPAIGIGLLVSFLTHQNTPPYPGDAEKSMELSDAIGSAIVNVVVDPLYALVIGWVVSLFMAG